MKIKNGLLLLGVVLALGLAGPAGADNVDLFVDAAPNAYGSPLYEPWKTAAFAAAASGTFTNMANSFNPLNAGTTNVEINDMVVYSFGDLGKRLHFVYWIPNETLSSLVDRFTISMYYQWDGVTYDFYNEYYGATWQTPSTGRWIDYDVNGDGNIDGVVGTAGFAWWAAYPSNDPAELAAQLIEWDRYQGNVIFQAKLITGGKIGRASCRERV